MTTNASRAFMATARKGTGLMALIAPAASLAHHAHDFAPPRHALEGLISGLAHPALSIPHLVALVVLGMLAARQPHPWRMVAGFCTGAMLTALVFANGLQGWPMHDGWVALTLALGGLALFRQHSQTRRAELLSVAIVVVAGSIHGQIAAESIQATELGILLAYWTGIACAQMGIAQIVCWGWARLVRHRAGLAHVLQLGGAALSAGVAATVLVGLA